MWRLALLMSRTAILIGLTAALSWGDQSGPDTGVYWVHFIDKGPRDAAAARVSLSARCLQRRAKARPASALIDPQDHPLDESYVARVRPHVRRVRHRSRWLNAISVEATMAQTAELSSLPMVRAVRPVARFSRPPEPTPAGVMATPDYGAAADQLDQLRVPYLHALGYTGMGVLVCLLDTGFYKDHESLRDLPVIAERDFVFGDGDTQRDPGNPHDFSDSHGTSVWSALGGFSPGHIIGPAHGASFLLAKTEDLRYELPIEEDHWVAAVEWADSAGADVVSSSLSYTVFDGGAGYTFGDLDGNTAVTTVAADRAAALGIAVVIAAGNYGSTSWGHIGTPADGDSVIAVGAVDASGLIASFSSPGPTADGRIKPEVCARGVATACASNATPTSYTAASGTSLSTPLVAGVAALLLEINPSWTGADVRDALMATADRAHSPDNRYGWGIVDAFAASGLQVPIIFFAGAVVDDDSVGASMGNGNGMIEPGERVELNVALANDGSAPSGEMTCTLSTEDGAVVLVRHTAIVPSLTPGDTASTAETLVFDYAPWGAVDTVVSFSLVVEGEAGDTLAEFALDFPAVRLFHVAGSVVESDSLAPVAGATVRVISANGSAPPDTFAADAAGAFSLWLPAGVYAFQARAPGFISPDGQIVDLPHDAAVTLELARPSLATPQDTMHVSLPADSAATVALILGNTGTGVLTCALQGVSSEGPWQWRDSFVDLRADPREGGSLDILKLQGSATAENLTIRVIAAEPWSAGAAMLTIGLDVDGDAENGRPAAGLSADYAVEWDGGARLLTAAGGRWMFVSEIEATGEDSTLTLVIPASSLSLLAPSIRCAVAMEQDCIPASIVVDRVPDDGGTDPVVWYLRTPAWLSEGTDTRQIAAGSSVTVTMGLDTHGLEPGTYPADLVFQGGFTPVNPVRITLMVAPHDSGQADLPTALEVSAPAPNPAAEGFRVRIGLPEPAPVVLELVDLAGRRVGRWPVGTLLAGWTDIHVPFEVHHPRGAYWLRVTTPGGWSGQIVVRD